MKSKGERLNWQKESAVVLKRINLSDLKPSKIVKRAMLKGRQNYLVP